MECIPTLAISPTTTLGDIPLDGRIREGSDSGCPVVATQPDSPLTAAYLEIASNVVNTLPTLQDPLAPR